MIRDAAGADWLLARSNSAWVDLTWSPVGEPGRAGTVLRRRAIKRPRLLPIAPVSGSMHLFTLDLKASTCWKKPPKPMARQGQFYYLAGMKIPYEFVATMRHKPQQRALTTTKSPIKPSQAFPRCPPGSAAS